MIFNRHSSQSDPLSADENVAGDLTSVPWDAIVIGTGMGGSTLGYKLARAGCKVLFLEKGHSHLAGGKALLDNYAEQFITEAKDGKSRKSEILAHAGRWNQPVADHSGKRPCQFVPLLGCGTGGSSALYGMALERLRPDDLNRTNSNAQAPAEADIPDAWPISYQTLAPYYQQAEQLFKIHGTSDPLRSPSDTSHMLTPPPFHPANQALFNRLNAKGLHPYRLPIACDYTNGDDRCQSFLDSTGRKHDASRTCLMPALQEHGAKLLDCCEVLKLEADHTKVNEIVCKRKGKILRFRSRFVVLAAGALASPCLLLRSSNRHWPRGLANRSGRVGRNLMRHFVDLYLVPAEQGNPTTGNIKELAFNDWYTLPTGKGGTVQSFGALPPPGFLVDDMASEFRQDRHFIREALTRLGRPVLKRVFTKLQNSRIVLASIIEDLPYPEHRVRPGNRNEAPTVITYRPNKMDLERVHEIRRRMQEVFKGQALQIIQQAENNKRLAHVCGTCRFGHDERSSVLNANNRAHGLENLYVADASFFPSSGGTNPALTIAANALRVADHLADRIGARVNQEQRPTQLSMEANHAHA